METIKRKWYSLPTTVRKPIIFVIGMVFVIASGLTGWLPGPGGIPLFLIGIAILATEFAWATRLRDKVMERVHHAGRLYRQHKVIGTIVLLLCICAAVGISITLYWLTRTL